VCFWFKYYSLRERVKTAVLTLNNQKTCHGGETPHFLLYWYSCCTKCIDPIHILNNACCKRLDLF
jgi:hypothetical protein